MRLMLNSILSIGLILLAGCVVDPGVKGSGKLSTETREPGQFTGIDVQIPTSLTVKKGESHSMEISIDDNLLPLIETSISDGHLVISAKKTISPTSAKLTITAPDLSSVRISGAADGTIEELSGANAIIQISGAAELKAGIKAEQFDCAVTGAGDLTITGTCPKVRVRITGAGDVNTSDVESDDVKVNITGAGTATVSAKTLLDVSITGSGDVRYSGPAEVRKSITGAGSVTQVDPPVKPDTATPSTPSVPSTTEASAETAEKATPPGN